MFLQRSTYLVAFLLCSLSVWCKMASAGSSYLSPSHKPQMRVKSRVGRQTSEGPGQPTSDNSYQVSAPFALDFTFNEQDFDDYAAIVQRILKNLLGDTPPPGPNN
ncbi:ghrelin/obestatin prepropeptide [Periophthalmus magnuspinnatus]|uniref:ghrelin/obestatin prepropeptide n=1 Tax=Periophthalmus magnuspinnatus TaxID=409849 RepID=UPI00145A7F44|nr:ghrelin/obestatin prepropeptide [Periophthalmus magnuspinnatus]